MMLKGWRAWLFKGLNIQAGESAWWGMGTSAGGIATESGVTVTPGNAMRTTTVSRCVSLISGTAAMMQLGMFRQTPDRLGRTEIFDDPRAVLVQQRPNDWQTPFEFFRHLFLHTALRGNGYAYLPRDGRGNVRAMIPLHSDFVQVFVADDLTPIYNFRFQYSNQRFRVGSDQMLHFRWQSDDGYLGASPIQLAARAIGLSVAAEEHGARFFGDGARAGGVITLPGSLTAARLQELANLWTAQHQGQAGSRRVTFLPNGAKYEGISVTPEESQFLETRGFQVEDICRAYGVPPSLAGATAKATSWGTGLEQQLKGFLSLTLLPWLEMAQQAVARSLLFADELPSLLFEFDKDKLLAADMLAQADADTKLVGAGIINRNEARSKRGYNPYADGDRFLVSANTVPAEPPAAPAPLANGHDPAGLDPDAASEDSEDQPNA